MTDNQKVFEVIHHELYGRITADQEVIDTKNHLLADLEQTLNDTIDAIINKTVEEIANLKATCEQEAQAIINSQPQVTEYPTNGILTIKLVG